MELLVLDGSKGSVIAQSVMALPGGATVMAISGDLNTYRIVRGPTYANSDPTAVYLDCFSASV